MTEHKFSPQKIDLDAARAAVADLTTFTTRDLMKRLGVNGNSARVVVGRLVDRGLAHALPSAGNRTSYAHGSAEAAVAQSREDVGPDMGPDPLRNMWRAMKALKQFGVRDIVAVSNLATAPVSEKDVEAFCRLLVGGEYLREMQSAKRGVRPAIYHLARWTGPIPPVQRRVRAIEDPNLERITYVAGIGVIE